MAWTDDVILKGGTGTADSLPDKPALPAPTSRHLNCGELATQLPFARTTNPRILFYYSLCRTK